MLGSKYGSRKSISISEVLAWGLSVNLSSVWWTTAGKDLGTPLSFLWIWCMLFSTSFFLIIWHKYCWNVVEALLMLVLLLYIVIGNYWMLHWHLDEVSQMINAWISAYVQALQQEPSAYLYQIFRNWNCWCWYSRSSVNIINFSISVIMLY